MPVSKEFNFCEKGVSAFAVHLIEQGFPLWELCRKKWYGKCTNISERHCFHCRIYLNRKKFFLPLEFHAHAFQVFLLQNRHDETFQMREYVRSMVNLFHIDDIAQTVVSNSAFERLMPSMRDVFNDIDSIYIDRIDGAGDNFLKQTNKISCGSLIALSEKNLILRNQMPPLDDIYDINKLSVASRKTEQYMNWLCKGEKFYRSDLPFLSECILESLYAFRLVKLPKEMVEEIASYLFLEGSCI